MERQTSENLVRKEAFANTLMGELAGEGWHLQELKFSHGRTTCAVCACVCVRECHADAVPGPSPGKK